MSDFGFNVTQPPYHCDGCDSEKTGLIALYVRTDTVEMRLCPECYMGTMLHLVRLVRDAKERR